MVRYFHQPEEYWLANCTLQKWNRRYSRELIETPPVDEFAVVYFKYQAPDLDAVPEAELLLPELPDYEE